MDDFISCVCFLAIMVVVIVAMCLGVMMVANHMVVRAEIAGIEQLRADVAVVDKGSDEDVLGLAAQTNVNIATYQKYNKIWWSRLAIPNRWDKVEFINMKGK